MPELAVIVPTRGRPENIRRVVAAWRQTGAFEDAELVAVWDADDPQRAGYARVYEESRPHLSKIEVQTWRPMVHKLDEAARSLAAAGYFAVGFAGDDHLPWTGRWAARYLAELRDLGTGIVYGDDGYQGANLPTEWAMTSDVVRALGRMVPAPVEHMYCDNAVRDLGRAAGCLRHLPDVVVEHVHPIAGKTASDDQYRRVNSREQFRRDRAAFTRWRRVELPTQAAAVRGLVPSRPVPAATLYGNPLRKGSTMNPSVNVPRRLARMQGATPMDICVTLADLAAQVPAGRAIVELGVYRAKTSIMMAWGAQQGGRAHVWGIDAWDLPGNRYDKPFTDPGSRNWARYNVKALGFANHVTLIHGFSVEQAEHWSGPPVGLLFVDADHSKEAALADLAAWTPHLAADAVIAFDDYGHPDWPGVAEAVDEAVERGLLEPVQVFHDRLAVTRLGSGHPELVRREQTESLADRGGTEFPLPAGTDEAWRESQVTAVTSEGAAVKGADDAEAARKALEDALEAPAPAAPPVVDVHLPEPATAAPEGPAGQAPAAAPGPPPAGAPATPAELAELAGPTALEELSVSQLRRLAQAREITLGRTRKTRDAALEALRAGG